MHLTRDSSGRPAILGEQFHALYSEAAAGRSVGSRLHHPPPPDAASRRRWYQRQTDVDLLGHANNSIALAAVEEVLADELLDLVEVEYRDPIEPGDDVELVTDDGWMWLTVGGRVRASARIEPDA